MQSRDRNRAALFALAITFTAGIVLTLYRLASERHLDRISNFMVAVSKPSSISRCGTFRGSNEIWEESQLKYLRLPDDKFTIAMQTFRRPMELNNTLQALLRENIPSLSEVVVIWNDVETVPPFNFESPHGVTVRFRQSNENSLNQKLWPDPEYQTQAIFLSDDDIYYEPQDLEFAFQSWRKFGKRRMTGGFARCAVQEPGGRWKYSFCSTEQGHNMYNMILSGLAFVHISYLDYYSSHDAVLQSIRAYVDEHFNCEDVAMNYLVSLLTGEGPLLVKGRVPFVNLAPANGISTRPGHLEARSKCLNDFVDLFGCMPLMNETARVEPGVIIS